MSQPKIQLRKVRDFSAKMNATFEFIRLNFLPLLKSIIYLAGPLIILAGIAAGYYQKYAFNFAEIFGQEYAVSEDFMLSFGALLLFSTLATVMAVTVVNIYVKLYLEKEDGAIEVGEVWSGVKENYFKVLAASILVFLITTVATLFLIIPGIYVGVVFSLVFTVVIIENISPLEALGRCFKLIKEKWWSTFGLIIVTGIIRGVLAFIFAVPMSVLAFLNIYHASSAEGFYEQPVWYETLLILASIVATAGEMVLYAIPLLALIFQYFNLVERNEAAGLMQQIETMEEADKSKDDQEDY